jgi:hypothetical protein
MYTVTLLTGAPSTASATHPTILTYPPAETDVLPVTLSTAESRCPNGGAGGAAPAVAATVNASGPNVFESPSESIAVTVTVCDPIESPAAE